MKRSGPLKRNTPLQRKTWMKRMSAKKAKEKRETDGPRAAFRDRVGECMNCGAKGRLEVHEIANGPNRSQAVYRERLQLVLCRACHDNFGWKTLYSPARQVGVRALWEIEQTVNELREVRGDTLVPVEDVLAWLRTDI